MSVATRNPFAILEAEDSRPPSPAPKAPAPAPAPPAPPRSSQKSRGGPAARGGKYYARGGKSASKDPNSTQNGVEDAAASEGQRKFEGRGRGRGGRGGAQRGGRRPYDKHSQTGKTDSDKKIQQSWGGADGKTELKVEEAAAVDATAEASEWTAEGGNTADWDAPAQGPATDAAPAAEGDKADGRPRKEKEAEEEDNTLTLDQYLAQQKEKESVVPKLESARQANEGADTNIWKDVVPLTKGEGEDSYFVGKTKAAPKARTKKEEKQYIEIDARFERPDRGGRGRGRGGDRGGDRARGGRGRGGARGNRPTEAPAVNVDDETAFPSLS
ncbi:hypothetical protein C0993_007589 [Termitomyces sp. T159_Od127]|nr:hypothetical protein C0993_007589 [Termitomyces sp. T159_Od127]